VTWVRTAEEGCGRELEEDGDVEVVAVAVAPG